jgi:glyoxylase-like metal-dependent hydrolase (beta-lactamase superfamily II)
VGKILSDDDCIDVSGLLVQIIATPGHSSCSLSAYVPKLKALFASDAGGIPYKGMILALGNSNFTRFQHSLEKLKDLIVEYVCADHYGCVAGDEARNSIRQTIEAARQGRASMEEVYRRTGAIDSGAKELTADFYRTIPTTFCHQMSSKGYTDRRSASLPMPGKKKQKVSKKDHEAMDH